MLVLTVASFVVDNGQGLDGSWKGLWGVGNVPLPDLFGGYVGVFTLWFVYSIKSSLKKWNLCIALEPENPRLKDQLSHTSELCGLGEVT